MGGTLNESLFAIIGSVMDTENEETVNSVFEVQTKDSEDIESILKGLVLSLQDKVFNSHPLFSNFRWLLIVLVPICNNG
jgi:hypothetical protein